MKQFKIKRKGKNMGIELGSVGSAAGGVATAAGRGISGLGRIGGEVPIMPDSFGVPMGKTFVSNIDLTGGRVEPNFSMGGEILFKSEPLASIKPTVEMDKASVLAGVEDILAHARIPDVRSLPQHEQAEIPQARPLLASAAEPLIFPVSAPFEAPVIKVQSEPGTISETSVAAQPAQEAAAVYSVAPKQQETEEVVEDKILIGQDKQDKAESQEIEESSRSKIKIVVAKKVSEERRRKIRKAVKDAKEKGITVMEALTDWNDKSPFVGRGKDWTLDLTAQELAIDPSEFNSTEEAEEIAVASVDKNAPVEEGEGARQVTVGEVNKVTHGEEGALKSKVPAQLVIERIVKKRIVMGKNGPNLQTVEDRVGVGSETTLKDLSLEKVFPKAA